MNYTKLFRRGSRYVDECCQIWARRKERLISRWARASDTGDAGTKRRVNHIINVLEQRMNVLLKMAYEIRQREEQSCFEAAHSIVMLECTRFECKFSPNGVVTGVKMKDYVPDSLTCSICGSTLVQQDAAAVEHMLWELGVEIQ